MSKASIPLLDLTADETLTLVKTGYTLLHSFELENIDTAKRYIQFFDAAAVSDVNLGTTVPTATYYIPPGDGTENGVRTKDFTNHASRYFKGLVYAVTTVRDGAVGPTTELPLNLDYD